MSEPLHADQLARKDFPLSFRGFDQHEVRAYLGQVSGEIARWRSRVEQLESRLAELESAPTAELDEVALEAALGREATRVIHAAREAAADIRARAEEESAAKVSEADARLASSRAAAENALASLRAATERRAAEIVEDAQAKAAAMLADAATARDGVLDELSMRRASLIDEIEALQRSRDALTSAFDAVRGAIEAVEARVGDADAHAAGVLAARARDLPPVVVPDVPAVQEPAVVTSDWSVHESDAGTEPAVPAEAAAPEPASDDRPDAESEPAPAVEPAMPATVEPEPVPVPQPEGRQSSSLTILRPVVEGRGTPVAPPVEDEFEGVRIIRPEVEPDTAHGDLLEPAATGEAGESDETGESDAAEAEPSDEGAVDGLFARLRADRAEKVANAEAVLAAPDTADGEPDADVALPAEVVDEVHVRPELEPDLAVLARRDETVADDERSLLRALKRALADEQNEVLDGLRRLRGAPTVGGLLPEREAHDGRFAAVLRSGVSAAAAAGGAAAGGSGGSAEAVATELAATVAGDLRARVERAIEEASGDVDTLAEAISSAYREWKTARAEPLARDAIAAGFAAGMYAASSGTLRWVVDPAEGGCPDCDDNVLAGATPKGSAYPTGQLHPPAHAGCRCIVVTVA